ncbi:uncharacterized protein LOC126837893 [Adelges cooleyi]|uniref:uncharacterized protein LOC126837893 n=1 Tax=Adelges cooleyi TaxID=133065 RepID=UPI00217F39FA|nr:uncharacterized protein LOC126837893 [Adelges cooleyi]
MSGRVHFLKTKLFPRAAAEGAFGVNVEYEDFDVDANSVAADHFASDILFGTVTTKTGDRHAVVIKFKNSNAQLSAMMNMHQKFYNEYVFYAKLLPELARASGAVPLSALFPRFVYSNVTFDGNSGANGDVNEYQVIVVQNMTPTGYRLSDERLFLDKHHVELALRKLGAFHGYSYAAKASETGRQKFLDLVGLLAETEWFEGYWYKSPRFLAGTGHRGLSAHVLNSETPSERLDGMRSLLDGNSETMAELLRPVEPNAVLCHGDFCRNNLLYKYDETGRPVDVLLFDTAQARYASPAVDLSFFLYLNTTEEDRRLHWDSYIAAYVAGMAKAFPGMAAIDVHQEMRPRALYGYAHCSFFLPAMVHPTPPDVEKLTTCTDDERIELINESGGPKADHLLASIVGHMIERQYV